MDDEVDAKNEENQENDTKSTGVENKGKSTGVDSNNEITGIKSESGNTGATDKTAEISLIEEAITEAERDIAGGKELLVGTETKTEDTQDKNVIRPYLQVPA